MIWRALITNCHTTTNKVTNGNDPPAKSLNIISNACVPNMFERRNNPKSLTPSTKSNFSEYSKRNDVSNEQKVTNTVFLFATPLLCTLE